MIDICNNQGGGRFFSTACMTVIMNTEEYLTSGDSVYTFNLNYIQESSYI
jgi:hypothetical protein